MEEHTTMKFTVYFESENLIGHLYVEADDFIFASAKALERIEKDRWGENAKITMLSVRLLKPEEEAEAKAAGFRIMKKH